MKKRWSFSSLKIILLEKERWMGRKKAEKR
jgi:hypothetical protein